MDEIRPWLYIGKYRDTLDKNYLDFKSIKAMLQLADLVEQKGINSLFLPVEDLGPTSPVLIRRGVDFILAEKEKGNKVLVACGAGMNRSTAFCMAALKETFGYRFEDGYLSLSVDIKEMHEGIALTFHNIPEKPENYSAGADVAPLN